jgi:hypothetical protein
MSFMYYNCKICNKIINVELPIKYYDSHKCLNCNKYHLILRGDGKVESETITIGNYYLCFLFSYQEACVLESNGNSSSDRKILSSFKMEELTHELAIYWSKKLKTYVLFQ